MPILLQETVFHLFFSSDASLAVGFLVCRSWRQLFFILRQSGLRVCEIMVDSGLTAAIQGQNLLDMTEL